MAESAEERALCPNCGAPAKWEYVQTETGSHHEWRFDQQDAPKVERLSDEQIQSLLSGFDELEGRGLAIESKFRQALRELQEARRLLSSCRPFIDAIADPIALERALLCHGCEKRWKLYRRDVERVEWRSYHIDPEEGAEFFCRAEYFQQAISQAEARTLAAVHDFDIEAYIQGLHWVSASEYEKTLVLCNLRTLHSRLRNLQPSSDSLRKLLREVAERVRDEDCKALVDMYEGEEQVEFELRVIRALDLDRIVDGVLGGKRE